MLSTVGRGQVTPCQARCYLGQGLDLLDVDTVIDTRGTVPFVTFCAQHNTSMTTTATTLR